MTTVSMFSRPLNKVARCLGGGWTVEYPGGERVARLVGPGEAALVVYLTWHDRVEISPVFPRGRNGDHYGPYQFEPAKITVASSRPPAAIAKDIQRRLLPAYLPALAEAVARRDRDAQHQREARAVADRLAAILPKSTVRENGSSYQVFSYEPEVTIQIHSDERVLRLIVEGA